MGDIVSKFNFFFGGGDPPLDKAITVNDNAVIRNWKITIVSNINAFD